MNDAINNKNSISGYFANTKKSTIKECIYDLLIENKINPSKFAKGDKSDLPSRYVIVEEVKDEKTAKISYKKYTGEIFPSWNNYYNLSEL